MSQFKFNYNDGGRSEAGYKGKVGDCAVRAAAIATKIKYEEVYWTLADIARNWKPESQSRRAKEIRSDPTPRNGVWREVLEQFLFDEMFVWESLMGIGTGCQVNMNPESFARQGASGIIVCRLSRHFSTVIDDVIHDTYDPSRGGTRCVYGWWRPVVDAPVFSR